MHRALKQEVATPPAKDRRAQQRQLQRFRLEYNQVRPHEALGMQTPASVYALSEREYPHQMPPVEYPETMKVCPVKSHGHFRWKQREVFLSEVLWGERIGLLPVDDRWFTIYFAHLPLASFDSRLRQVVPLPKGFNVDGAGEEDASPSPAPHPLNPGAESVRCVPGLICQVCSRLFTGRCIYRSAADGRSVAETTMRTAEVVVAEPGESCRSRSSELR